MNPSITLRSFAKVNYTLDVLSARPDGYHNIATVMQTISLADSISISSTDESGLAFECDAEGIPTDSSNLVVKAAELALRQCGSARGLRIRLDKQVPSQAGLGGGSSNAAYTLMGINRLLSLELDREELSRLAEQVGSDVPFFLTGGTAVGRGRGETITPLEDGPAFWLVVVKPDVSVSTAWAYHALDALPYRQSARATRRMQETLSTADHERIYSRMTNDFEQAVFAAEESLALLHDELMMARCVTARLCGSGSALFGICRSAPDAQESARIMRLKYRNVYVCRTVPRAEALTVDPLFGGPL